MREAHETKLYAIIATGYDGEKMGADHPGPKVKGSFFSIDNARAELERLIALKKADLDSRYDYEYREDDWWEMFEGGNYGGCFARIEIVEIAVRWDIKMPGTDGEGL